MTKPIDELTQSKDLVRRAQAGDRSAYSRLFTLYYKQVELIVRARMPAELRKRTDIEDLVQTTFVDAIRDYKQFEFRENARFLDWLATLAINNIKDELARMKASKRDPAREIVLDHVRSAVKSGEIVLEPVDRNSLPIDAVANAELIKRIQQTIEELEPEDYRNVIILRHYAGADWSFISEKLGKPTEAAARAHYDRARLALLRKLRANGVSLGTAMTS